MYGVCFVLYLLTYSYTSPPQMHRNSGPLYLAERHSHAMVYLPITTKRIYSDYNANQLAHSNAVTCLEIANCNGQNKLV